ncbi:hypothetical protein LINPERHAP2_LOCUS20016 [Linum perenne]
MGQGRGESGNEARRWGKQPVGPGEGTTSPALFFCAMSPWNAEGGTSRRRKFKKRKQSIGIVIREVGEGATQMDSEAMEGAGENGDGANEMVSPYVPMESFNQSRWRQYYEEEGREQENGYWEVVTQKPPSAP